MKHVYKKSSMIKYNNKMFQIIIREDNSKGFLKVLENGNEKKFEYPTAHEFLHLSSFVNINNRIKF